MIISDVDKKYNDLVVFEKLNLTIKDHEITAILGPSGCGKTTLLNIISKTTDYSGTIEGNDGKISYLFQSQRLLSNLTVKKNIEYVLRSYLDKQEREKVTNDILKKVELTEFANYYPSQLSGGMAQRVSIARAFAYDSDIMLMDEPFKGLDISLKKKIIDVFLRLYTSDKKTTLFVTHDIDDALIMANRIIVLSSDGKIVLDETINEPFDERDVGMYGDLRAKIYQAI
ncbi:MAG: ATP-binding cassette domain-containing protein [Clostridia bacterium]|nr:ATP-binding cassette domain-containing protein [Clostridia bacterium]